MHVVALMNERAKWQNGDRFRSINYKNKGISLLIPNQIMLKVKPMMQTDG